MGTPWPRAGKSAVPDGCAPDAVARVRAAYRVHAITMAQWLGITVSELVACERDGVWPRSANARAKLLAIARTEGVEITAPAEAEPSLF